MLKNKTCNTFLISLLVLCQINYAAVNEKKGASEKQKKPNVIIIITDDQGYGDVGAHGNSNIQTPNIDKLYDQSIRLTNFHVSPTCAPTRAALLTGQYSNKTGVWHTIGGRSLLLEGKQTIADVFSENGYNTAIFGKWHLGDNYPYRPQDRGFQETLIHGAGGIGQTPDFWDNDYFDDTYLHNGVRKPYKGYCTDVWFEESLKYIEKIKDEPFLCYISTNAPHGPFFVENKYSNTYEDNPNIVNPEFYGMITNVDDNVGLLTRRLESLGIADNTILIFMSDNGTAAGGKFNKDDTLITGYNAGMRGKKNSAYDGGHRVPFYIKWPAGKIKSGVDINTLSAHIDILPTLVDMCGLNIEDTEDIDGVSLKPLLFGKDKSGYNRTLIVDTQRAEYLKKYKKYAVMSQDWRFVNGKELYKINTDPDQSENVANEYPLVVNELKEAYELWWENVSVNANTIAPISIGNKESLKVDLTSHDWHSEEQNPWNQNWIRKGIYSNGFWQLNVENSGTYEFVLRRWPSSTNGKISGELESRKAVNETSVNKSIVGKSISIVSARLKISDFDRTSNVSKSDTQITFTIKLKKGIHQLNTWFIDDQNNSLGAYYVQVNKL